MTIRILRGILKAAAWLVGSGCAAWAVGAVAFDSPWPSLRPLAAGALTLALVVAVALLPGNWSKLGALFGGFLLVLAWWLTLQPSNTRHWQPDVARTAWAETDGDTITLHDVRNCDYRTETDYTPSWETRTVRLSQLAGVDVATIYWGSPWIAHVIVSFRFADAPPICFSIETRMEVGEIYSALAGFYRRYELIYVVADERDVIRVRTNYRPGAHGQGEDVYLYRTTATPEQARVRFLEYLHALNALHDHPRWYNAVTANCLTSIRTQSDPAHRSRWDWRLLLNGKMDQLLYERGDLVTGALPFPALKARSLINPAARAAGNSPNFSTLIRWPLLSN